MALQEIEDALKRVAESQLAHVERMDRIDRKLEQLADSHAVQAVLLDRLDRKVTELADVSHHHHQALESLAKVAESHNQQLLRILDHAARESESVGRQLHELAETAQNHERRLVGVEDQTALMLSALNSLLQRMDAFIQGLQKGDGHSGGTR